MFVPLSTGCRTAMLKKRASSLVMFGRARAEMKDKIKRGKNIPVSLCVNLCGGEREGEREKENKNLNVFKNVFL